MVQVVSGKSYVHTVSIATNRRQESVAIGVDLLQTRSYDIVLHIRRFPVEHETVLRRWEDVHDTMDYDTKHSGASLSAVDFNVDSTVE
jgi:hypothetical protein